MMVGAMDVARGDHSSSVHAHFQGSGGGGDVKHSKVAALVATGNVTIACRVVSRTGRAVFLRCKLDHL